MSRRVYLILLCALCCAWVFPAVLNAGEDEGRLYLIRNRNPMVPGEGLLSRRLNDFSVEADAGQGIVAEHAHTGTVLAKIDPGLMEALEARDDLVIVPADVSLVTEPPPEQLLPDGPGDSWHMTLVRDLRDTWPVASEELADVAVACMDTGIMADHPDLQGSLMADMAYNATGEGLGGIESVEDGNGHGTSVAGIIVGVATGVSSNLDLIPVKFADSRGEASLADFDRGLNYLLGLLSEDEGVLYGRRLVINVSYSTAPGTMESEAIRDYFLSVFEAVRNLPVLFVFAGGNDQVDVGKRYVYPPSLEATNLVAVAASTSSDGLAESFSNFGRGRLEVCAPGEGITTTSKGAEGYATVYGTSFAAPFVSGVAAWIWASNPQWSSSQVRNVLMNLVLDPYWTENHHLAPTRYTVPVLSGGAMLFNVLDGGQAFLDEAAGTVARALDVRVPPGEQEEVPGSESSDSDESWIEEIAGGGGCRLGPLPLWLLLPVLLVVLRRR